MCNPSSYSWGRDLKNLTPATPPSALEVITDTIGVIANRLFWPLAVVGCAYFWVTFFMFILDGGPR